MKLHQKRHGNARRLSDESGAEGALSKPVLIRACLIAAVFAAAGAALFLHEKREDTIPEGYLLRGDYGTGAYYESLEAQTADATQRIEIRVEPRQYRPDEVERFLDEAEARVFPAVLGGQDPDHIDRDLELVASLDGLPVGISWVTYPNAVLDYEGRIGRKIPEEGASAWAEAEIACQEERRTVRIDLTVFPKQETAEEARLRETEDAIGEEDATSERVYLPSTLGGKEVRWSHAGGSAGAAVAGLGLLIAFVYVYSVRKRSEERRDSRKKEMMLDYPVILNKLVLYLGAGMSMRMSFARIASDYLETRKNGAPVRQGMETVVTTARLMENGRSETEAYARLGEAEDLQAYRTLSVLLLQNLKKGSSELLKVLKEEADQAFEERKRQARILGEEAGTKLLFPMLLMLLVVLVILVVPAFLGIYGAQR